MTWRSVASGTPQRRRNAACLPKFQQTVARRQRYAEVRGKLAAGEVSSINDFITYNLDIEQFAQDVIDNTDSPDLLRAFWKALTELTVLDPTVGSGAFLFAALNILESLYEASLERMEAFIGDSDRAGGSVAEVQRLPRGIE